LSAPLLLDDEDDPEDPLPWEKSPLLAPVLDDALLSEDAVELLLPDALVEDEEELLSSPACPSVPGPAPERPGIVAASEVEVLDPDDAADG